MRKNKTTYTTPMTAEVKALIERYNSLEPLDNGCFDMKWLVEFAKRYINSKSNRK